VKCTGIELSYHGKGLYLKEILKHWETTFGSEVEMKK
jgi:hypothetical protein